MIFFAGALFTAAVGLLERYLCRRFGTNRRFAAILPLNESIWEQLKTIFWPMLVFCVFEYFNYGMYFDNFTAAKAVSVFSAMAWSVALSYIYDAIWANRSAAANTCIFILSCITGWTVNFILVKNYCLCSGFDKISGMTSILILMVCFVLFSAAPPQKSIFNEKKT